MCRSTTPNVIALLSGRGLYGIFRVTLFCLSKSSTGQYGAWLMINSKHSVNLDVVNVLRLSELKVGFDEASRRHVLRVSVG